MPPHPNLLHLRPLWVAKCNKFGAVSADTPVVDGGYVALGVTPFEAIDGSPMPIALMAETRNV